MSGFPDQSKASIEKLQSALARATAAVLSIAPLDGSGEFIFPTIVEERFVREHHWGGGGSEGHRQTTTPDPESVLLSEWPTLAALQGVSGLLEISRGLASHSVIHSDVQPVNSTLPLFETLVERALSRMIRCAGLKHNLQECSRDVSDWLGASLQSEKQLHLIVAPLFNFDCSLESPLLLPWGVTVSRASRDIADEMSLRMGLFEQFRPRLPFILRTYTPQWVLARVVETRWNSGVALDETVGVFTATVNLMTLLRRERTAFSCAVVMDHPWTSSGPGVPNYFFPAEGTWSLDEGPYVLTEQNHRNLVGLLGRLGSLKQDRHSAPLSVAISRMGDVSLRLLERDQVIDSVIAMEALLVSNESSEVSYRFSLLGSIILANERVDRLAAQRLLKQAYRRRSALVHKGSETKVDPTTIEIVDAAKRIVTRALMLSDRVSPDELPDFIGRYLLEADGDETLETFASRVRSTSAGTGGRVRSDHGAIEDN